MNLGVSVAGNKLLTIKDQIHKYHQITDDIRVKVKLEKSKEKA